jgi:hypothetical protein
VGRWHLLGLRLWPGFSARRHQLHPLNKPAHTNRYPYVPTYVPSEYKGEFDQRDKISSCARGQTTGRTSAWKILSCVQLIPDVIWYTGQEFPGPWKSSRRHFIPPPLTAQPKYPGLGEEISCREPDKDVPGKPGTDLRRKFHPGDRLLSLGSAHNNAPGRGVSHGVSWCWSTSWRMRQNWTRTPPSRKP